jgi:hypothetical protein
MAKCGAACPKMVAALAKEDEEYDAVIDICADLDGTVGCTLLHAAECDGLHAMLSEGRTKEQGSQLLTMECKEVELKCGEKGTAIMSKPACATAMTEWTKGGEASCAAAGSTGNLEPKKDTCCPHLKAFLAPECYPVECFNLETAKAKLELTATDEFEERMYFEKKMTENMHIASTCEAPGALASSGDVDACITGGSCTKSAQDAVSDPDPDPESAQGAVSDFAALTQATPVVAFSAMVLAVFA